jgi:hypothetical protein
MKNEIGFGRAGMALLLIGLVVTSPFAYLGTVPNAGAGTSTHLMTGYAYMIRVSSDVNWAVPGY